MQPQGSSFAVWSAIVLLALGPSAIADTVWPAPATPSQITVTTDSERGWLPSQEQVAQVRKTTDDFLAAKDGGRYAEAYAVLADVFRQNQPLGPFTDGIQKFNAQAGRVIERRVVAVTWTKNPAQAPAPGVYAALDLVSQFANVDRHCGYLVLYQAPTGGPFRVMREEDNFMDNATAKSMAQTQSSAAVDATWAKLSSRCPNYTPPPLPESPNSTVGYPTVAAALDGLRADAKVKFGSQAGWAVAIDDADKTIWSFAPAGDPSYPSVVKRQIVPAGGGVAVQMTVLCQSTKQACDNLVREFEQLNDRMKASLSSK
jgi:hypothetical protein